MTRCFQSVIVFLGILLGLILPGCGSKTQNKADEIGARDSARTSFEHISKDIYQPSASATGADRQHLEEKAASAYLDFVKKYPSESNYCAQALRSVGNIRASQTNVDAAVKFYSRVGEHYGSQSFEVLQAWKSAADSLWESNRRAEARDYYRRIVTRFDQPDEPAVIKTVVRGSKARLAE